MFSRWATKKNAQRIVRLSRFAAPIYRSGFATVSSGATSLSYGIANVADVKIACKDVPGPATRLAVVAKAGTRYQTAPGLSSALAMFAFKNTSRRSALRITREAELLGSQLVAHHYREYILIEAKFLQENLPYFTELLAEVISQTKFTTHEFQEQVSTLLKLTQDRLAGNASEIALESAHGIAFHRGLGSSLYPSTSSPITKYLDAETISQFASSAYSKPNIAVIANGAGLGSLEKWVGEFFKDISSGTSPLSSKSSEYYGGEERIHHPTGNSMVIAFPGSSISTATVSKKSEIYVLAALLGGQSSIKWTTGFSLLSKSASNFPGASAFTSNLAYSDAGLLTIRFSGSAEGVRKASFEAHKILKNIADGLTTKEDFTKAVSLAKFKILEESHNCEDSLISTGIGIIHGHKPFQIEDVGKSIATVSQEKLKAACQSLLASKATVSAVGDLHVLPYAEEIGFKV